MLEKAVGFQLWGNSPPLCSYYPIILQSSSARFAMVREGLRARSEKYGGIRGQNFGWQEFVRVP